MSVVVHRFFVAARGLSLVMANRGYSIVEVCRLPIVMASLIVEHGLSSTGSIDVMHGLKLPHGMCDLSSPGQGLNQSPLHWQADS